MKIRLALLFLIISVLSSCSHDKSALVSLMGDEAVVAAIILPEQMLKDSGIKDISEVSNIAGFAAGADIEKIAMLKGLDFSEMALVEYAAASPVAIMHVKDGGDLEKSLKGEKFVRTSETADVVYELPDHSISVLIDDDVMYAGLDISGAALVENVEIVRKKASSPLASWKQKALEGKEVVRGIVSYSGGYNKLTLTCEKQKLNVHGENYNEEGKSYNPYEGLGIKPLDGNTDCLDTEAYLSVAIASADYAGIMDKLPRGWFDSLTRTIVRGTLKSVAGPVRMSLSMPGDDIYSFQDWSLNVCCRATDERAAEDLVSTLQTGCQGMGFYVKDIKNGFLTRFDGAQVNCTAKGKDLLIASDHQIVGRKPSGDSVRGAICWLSVNLPVELQKAAGLTDAAPVKITVKLSETSEEVTAEIYDTDMTILEFVKDVLKCF